MAFPRSRDLGKTSLGLGCFGAFASAKDLEAILASAAEQVGVPRYAAKDLRILLQVLGCGPRSNRHLEPEDLEQLRCDSCKFALKADGERKFFVFWASGSSKVGAWTVQPGTGHVEPLLVRFGQEQPNFPNGLSIIDAEEVLLITAEEAAKCLPGPGPAQPRSQRGLLAFDLLLDFGKAPSSLLAARQARLQELAAALSRVRFYPGYKDKLNSNVKVLPKERWAALEALLGAPLLLDTETKPYRPLAELPGFLPLASWQPCGEASGGTRRGFRCDGLVFASRLPTGGMDLKWKESRSISADFLVRGRRPGSTSGSTATPLPLQVWCPSRQEHVAFEPKEEASVPAMCVLPEGAVDDCLLSWEAIAEFTLQGGQWIFQRLRADKVHANTSETISSILELAKSPITPEDLVASCRSLPRKEVEYYSPVPDDLRTGPQLRALCEAHQQAKLVLHQAFSGPTVLDVGAGRLADVQLAIACGTVKELVAVDRDVEAGALGGKGEVPSLDQSTSVTYMDSDMLDRSDDGRLQTMVLEEGPQNTVTFSVTPRDDGTLDVFVGTIGRTHREHPVSTCELLSRFAQSGLTVASRGLLRDLPRNTPPGHPPGLGPNQPQQLEKILRLFAYAVFRRAPAAALLGRSPHESFPQHVVQCAVELLPAKTLAALAMTSQSWRRFLSNDIAIPALSRGLRQLPCGPRKVVLCERCGCTRRFDAFGERFPAQPSPRTLSGCSV
ncbi:unnamed protein product [Symbiodinium sp. CCMP2456]|nr:unnamed protein product [Symbiodinium sp. CCMP2456]